MLAAVVVLLGTLIVFGSPVAVSAAPGLTGVVESGGAPLDGYDVTLYRTVPDGQPAKVGSAATDSSGAFTIPAGPDVAGGIFYVLARSGANTPVHDSVTLAAVLGPQRGASVTINPLTTVATAYAMAQFLHRGVITGPQIGVANAASMAPNVADPVTGVIGHVLNTSPNGTETTAVKTFNSLANLVAACVASAVDCDAMRTAATPAGGTKPADSLQALRNVVVDPSHNVLDFYGLAQNGPTPYAPARTTPPDAWTLALRFDGDGTNLEGPGNFALDHDGNMWVLTNYTYAAPDDLACYSNEIVRFSPNGSYYPGSPYVGGGLSGAGYGIDIDRYGDVWASNFGFGATECANQPPHNTLSRFTADGTVVSPPEGYTIKGADWPQGMQFDAKGTLWVANCQSDNVTYMPDGDPSKARTLDNLGVKKPFDVAFGSDGNAYVTGTESSNVAVVSPDGTPVGSPLTGFDKPMGITADATGALWVSNSGLIDLPCPTKNVSATPPPSVGYVNPATGERATYKGGGLVIPWGITVDGHDNVWVSNFGGGRLSGFCGRDNSPWCPAGDKKGDPLSPDVTGYSFDGLRRATAVKADTAGNMWVTNNWKEVPTEQNPGGYQVVVFLGIAGPVQPPAPEPKPAPAPAPAAPATPVVAAPKFTG